MNKLRKFTLAALLVATVLVSATPAFARKVNEYEGQHIAGEEGQDQQDESQQLLTRKVNEYEGQH